MGHDDENEGGTGHPYAVDTLHALDRELESLADPLERTRCALMVLEAWLGAGSSDAGISAPDRNGRLRRIAGSERPGRERPRLPTGPRREAFFVAAPVRVPLREPACHDAAFIPLVSAGGVVGVLEAVAPEGALSLHWEKLTGVADRVTAAMDEIREQARQREADEAVAEEDALMRSLLRAQSPQAIASAIVRFFSRRLRAPVASWVAPEGGAVHQLVAWRGVSRDAAAALRDSMASIPRWEQLEPLARWDRMSQFAAIATPVGTCVVHQRELLVFLGAVPPRVQGTLKRVARLLEEALQRLAAIRSVDRRSLDLGLAWTAHELRSPLLGAKAAIERLIFDGHARPHPNGSGGSEAMPDREAPPHLPSNGSRALGRLEQELLVRCWQDLDQLAGQVDSLLRWGAGKAVLRRRRTDMVQVVHEAVRDAAHAADTGRVSVAASGAVLVGDGDSLRVAIANLVRNALTYSPQDSPVAVRVHRRDGAVRVSVRDRGAGVLGREQSSIFDPFVRGRSGRGMPMGKGLGLFIAHRVVDAHGGNIGVESNGSGATFYIELPVGSETWKRRTRVS